MRAACPRMMVVASTSQRKGDPHLDEFLSVGKKRTKETGSSAPRHPPESLSPCLLHLHTMPEETSARLRTVPRPFDPTYHPNVV